MQNKYQKNTENYYILEHSIDFSNKYRLHSRYLQIMGNADFITWNKPDTISNNIAEL